MEDVGRAAQYCSSATLLLLLAGVGELLLESRNFAVGQDEALRGSGVKSVVGVEREQSVDGALSG